MDVYLTITEDNVDDLQCVGIDCVVGDELSCTVDYGINYADPDVGLMRDDCQIHGVYYGKINLDNFFDVDALSTQILENMENAADDAADKELDRRRSNGDWT